MNDAPRCYWCSGAMPVVDGRLVAHAIGAGERQRPCPASGTVPWRTGTPDEATVRAHLQEHEHYDCPVALFQVQHMGMFPSVVGAGFICGCLGDECEPNHEVRLRWAYGLPLDAQGKAHGDEIEPGKRWAFRPLDINTHDPRPWVAPAAEGGA